MHQNYIKAKQLWSSISIEHTPIETIMSQLKSLNSNFIDPNFPPLEISLYPQELVDVGGPFDTQIVWKRPIEFLNQIQISIDQIVKPTIFSKQIEPADIKEGSLGDSWFLGALALLSEQPQLIEKLFVNKTYNEEGIYRVRLCKNGEWQSITVDDYFPCHQEGGPIFSSVKDKSLWILILEKAYAKLHGSYLALRGGFTIEALQDLTGCPCIQYDLINKIVQSSVQDGSMWNILNKYQREKFLMSASKYGEDDYVAGSFVVELDKHIDQQSKLIQAHSYGILGLFEQNGGRFVQLRNAWGTKIDKYQVDSQDPSLFIMSYEDFTQYFRRINVCRTSNWNEIRMRGKFLRISDEGNYTNEIVLSKWYYTFEIKKSTQLFIGINQEDERINFVGETRPYLDVGIIIMKILDDMLHLVQMKDLVEARYCELDAILEPGTYIILPKTSGCTLKIPNQIDSQYEGDFEFVDQNQNASPAFSAILKEFFKTLNKNISENEFQQNILNKYCSTQDGITFQGFQDFWINSLIQFGKPSITQWLNKLGYSQTNGRFFSNKSRVFVLTIHSDNPIHLNINDSLLNDIEFQSNQIIIRQFGREIFKNGPLSIYCAFSELVNIYSFLAIHNECLIQGEVNEECVDHPIEVKIDLSLFKDMVSTNTHQTVITKFIEPNDWEFMFHAKIVNVEYKEPLKPSISYQRVMQSD